MTVLTLSLGGNVKAVVNAPDGPITVDYPRDDTGVNLSHVWDFLHRIYKELHTMSDNTDTKFAALDAKIEQLITAQTAMADRVNAKLAAAEAARDTAVADLATTKATLTETQAQLAAMPQVDTAAIEARLTAEAGKLDGVIAGLNAIDAAPVTAEPVPAETAPVEVPPVAAEPAPVATDPAAPAPVPAADPAAPTGPELTPIPG